MVTERFEVELTIMVLHGWAKCGLPFCQDWLKYIQNLTYSANARIKACARDVVSDMEFQDQYQDLLRSLKCAKTTSAQDEECDGQNDSDDQISQDNSAASAFHTESQWGAAQVKCASDY